MRAMMLVVIAMLAVPAGAVAQGVAVSPIHVSAALLPGAPAPQEVPRLGVPAAASQKNYWLEGAIGGGVLLGVAGFLLVNGLCDDDSGTDNCTSDAVIAGLSTATAGGVIGAFIGKAIPKK
ncbi:MAG TPA: hypothetical protein VFK36_01610 [Gemmatimonadales bacterium]|nr:hypothetical protein [Gemmatimonadales bacterium]